jgi:2-phospho-L-lactate/phosphoenolpyruvate guanylyltransferase
MRARGSETSDIYGILPVKALSSAKRRLACCLSPAGRRVLMLHLYVAALGALLDVLPAEQVAVVSHDRDVLALARSRRARALLQCSYGLNQAVSEGQTWAADAGAGALLVLLADLPLVGADALREMLARRPSADRSVVLAPGQRGGTHALYVRPLGWLPFAFGAGSFERHASAALGAGAQISVYHSPALALDVDLEDDLDRALVLRPDLAERLKHERDSHIRHP